MLGDSKVGKTSILQMFKDNKFSDKHMSTMGVDHVPAKYQAPNGEEVSVKIWDTAGQERFRTITYSFYKQANGVIIAFDMTSLDSFNNVKTWLDGIYQHADPNIGKVLVGNKLDLADQREVTYEMAKELAEQHSMEYFETSAKLRTNIDEVMQHIMKLVYKKMF